MSVSFQTEEVVDRLGCIKATGIHEIVVYEDRGKNLNYFLQRDLNKNRQYSRYLGAFHNKRGFIKFPTSPATRNRRQESGAGGQQAESSPRKFRILWTHSWILG
ncbi:hypothetical protein EVAR_64223_1 [Eumeta japonica]|uniref:Uncharacterized protein n=1 Tax=Eumeta variegata TaxID=151549 RepID=A0A4C1ZPN3_EUMVA|nr:hypothetical protein EVAR_64223_1 [Eumeta japonica]